MLLGTTAAGSDTVAAYDLSEERRYRVLLNGKEVGFHNFRIAKDGDRRHVESQARFDVRVLFITAYRYRHTNRERWEGSCLTSLDSQTTDDGKTVSVTGAVTNAGFVVSTGRDEHTLSSCVMTFAYWDVSILRQGGLLNAQTGEFLEVEVKRLTDSVVSVRGEDIEADHYRLIAKDTRIDLWYSKTDEWLALESPAKGGRTLRYELI